MTPAPDVPSEDEAERPCRHESGARFDRTICPEPCGFMHNYCEDCGEILDECPHPDLDLVGGFDQEIVRDQAAEIERLRGALRAMARRVGDQRADARSERRWADHYHAERDLVIREHREAAKAYNHTASQLLRERDALRADLAAQAQCDELRRLGGGELSREGQEMGLDMTPLWDRAREVLADNRIVADGLQKATAEPDDTDMTPDEFRALMAKGSPKPRPKCRTCHHYLDRDGDDGECEGCYCPDHGPAPAEHVYLSTACQHEIHRKCRDQCKFCPARCRCSCHPWSGDLHPCDEACIHCATPARLASPDPVIDCPREECPQPRPTAVSDENEKKEN